MSKDLKVRYRWEIRLILEGEDDVKIGHELKTIRSRLEGDFKESWQGSFESEKEYNGKTYTLKFSYMEY